MTPTTTYPGPVRDEPLAIELHNTLHVVAGAAVDGLADERGLRAWLAAVRDRLPAEARGADPRRLADFRRLRDAVREVLRAASERRPAPPAAVRALNEASVRSPRSVQLVDRRGDPRVAIDHHGADATDVALGAISVDAIELVAGDRRGDLGSCGAPGCVLMYLRDHPRRAWCSAACGNRARQARHYRRTHAQLTS